MENILLSCKMFKNSKRQQKILAAMNSNMKLVKQISSYVTDDRFVPVEEQEPKNDTTSTVPKVSIRDGQGSGGSNLPSGGLSNPKGDLPGMTVTGEPSESETSESTSESETSSESTEPASTPDTSEGVEQSTILSTTTFEHSSEQTDIIKGTLNAREDTAGVIRVRVKKDPNELWIYYEDKVNLNNTMPAVIEVLNGTAYTYLEFSRLARSDNAIVFDITCNPESMKPLEVEEDA